MGLLCLVSLAFLDINAYDLLSNIMRGAFYGTIFISLFTSSLFIIMKCARSIPVVNTELYQPSELYWETGTGTCTQ